MISWEGEQKGFLLSFFILFLLIDKHQFVAVDNPHATDLVLHITAAFAQYEREQISTRIKEALQAAKRSRQEWLRSLESSK